MKLLLLAILSFYPMSLTPPAQNLTVTVHDAAGRTFVVNAHWDSMVFDNGQITLEIETDSYFCGNFEP